MIFLNFRCSLNSTITLKSYDGGPYLLLMHPDPTLEGRLRYAIREGRTRLGRLAAASRSSSLYHEVLSSICDSSAKGDDTLIDHNIASYCFWLAYMTNPPLM